jgi:hypothetical protein
MSTKNVDTTQGNYNQGSMNTFNSFQPNIQSNINDFMKNPLQSTFFNTQLQMANRQNAASFGANNQTMMQNYAAGGGGIGNTAAYMQSNLLRNQRALSGANSNSFNNLLLGANQLRFGATSGAMNYRPLQTGQTQTKTQSGLGTWLPQVLGGALGIAGGIASGGASMAGGGGIGSMFARAGVGQPSGGPGQGMWGSMQPSTYDPGNTLIGPDSYSGYNGGNE